MIVHGLALAALIRQCAPAVAPSTMAAIVRVESGGNPLAIGDNTTRRSYYPRDRATAERLARRLLNAGHVLDLGIAQIDSMNFPGFGVNVHTIFDPCTDLSIGAKILSDDYAVATRRYGNGQVALRHAIGMYNSGRLDAGTRYLALVLAAAAIRDGHAPSPRVAAKRAAVHAPALARVAIRYREVPGKHRERATPARSEILVSNVSRVIVF